MAEINRVVMMGMGYIGLPTAAIIASRGIDVVGVDINRSVVDIINSGKIHIVEPDLDTIVHGVVTTGKLRAMSEPHEADVFMIAVPTPFKGDDHVPDIAAIHAVAKAIAPLLQSGNLVILESTSPVGTTEQLAAWLAAERHDLKFPHQSATPDIHIAYCPERVLPGKVLRELVDNDRIIGGLSDECALKAKELYSIFVQGECLIASARVAEMCKLTENAFRDVNIAFANELSMICDKLDVDVWQLINLANHHPRVNILQPGPGVGGHCIAVDPWFIVDSAPKEAQLIRTAREVNDYKPQFVVAKIRKAAKQFKSPTIACLGLTFKADIDDLRESPALNIVTQLVAEKLGRILVVEPHIEQLPQQLNDNDQVSLCALDKALDESDIVVLLVGHREFKTLIDNRDAIDNSMIDVAGFLRSE